jgi:hypothetical protein
MACPYDLYGLNYKTANLKYIFFRYFTQDIQDKCTFKMRLYFYRGGSFQHHELPKRSRCCPLELEKAIRATADASGHINSVSIQIGNEYIPILHMDEARVVSRMITADHDCFTSHLYENGFAEEEEKKKSCEHMQQDLHEENELWKLEFDYEQNADLGTPCFGSSDAYAHVYKHEF